jgi:hypothetical protein
VISVFSVGNLFLHPPQSYDSKLDNKFREHYDLVSANDPTKPIKNQINLILKEVAFIAGKSKKPSSQKIFY